MQKLVQHFLKEASANPSKLNVGQMKPVSKGQGLVDVSTLSFKLYVLLTLYCFTGAQRTSVHIFFVTRVKDATNVFALISEF